MAAAKKTTKTAFILSLPRDLPAAEAVEKAKAAGVKITEAYVYKIRSRSKAGSGTKKGKPGPKKKGGKASASAFVRKYPDKKAGEIVELAKKAGVKVTAGLVYTTRAYDKKKSGAPKGRPGRKPKYKTPKFQLFSGGGGGSEADLKRAALAVGFPRAREIVAELEKKYESVQKQYQALLG